MPGCPRNITTPLLPCLALALSLAIPTAHAQETKRVPWTTSHIHGSPDPPKPFVAQRIYGGVTFDKPTEIEYDPVSKCWLTLEQWGKLFALRHDDPAAKPVLCADLKTKYPNLDYLYGLALHPRYAENHAVFLCYTLGADIDDATKVSRFQMKRDAASGLPVLDLASEQVIFTWRSGGHNGANLQFGPDGMLYISTGDAASPSPPDPFNTGQDVSDLLSSILRIDVDHADPGRAYAIPKDNPFVGQMVDSAEHKPKPARSEIWAYGLRNPWKMSFDRATGRLWCADVGWELWESVDLIERGGNYGWSAVEASQPVRADAPKGPTPIRPPVVAHSHDEAASITGGYVYHGKKFPELEGAYIYGDWATGKIWALWYDGKQVTRHDEIADTHHKIVTFGQDADGEIIYADYNDAAGLYALQHNPAPKTEKFPTKLSETGLFKGYVHEQEPADGVYPFEISLPMSPNYWSITKHWIAIPSNETIQTKVTTIEDKGNTKAEYQLIWPKDSVLVKTIMSPLIERYGPEETQILHFDGVIWNAYTFRWNEKRTDADLVPARGEESVFDGQNKDIYRGEAKKMSWHFSSRAECMRCHNPWCGTALAFQPAQLRSDFKDQIRLLEDLRLVDNHFVDQSSLALTGAEFSNIADRARSYLHANCSHCHRQNAGGAVNMMLNAELLLAQTRTLGVTPQQGGMGLPNGKLIDPGNPWNSVICVRMATEGAGHMPIVGPTLVDVRGLMLIEDWIARMGGRVQSAQELLPTDLTDSALIRDLAEVKSALPLLRAIDENPLDHILKQHITELAWKSPNPTVRAMFERFKPEDQREKTLGTQIDSAALLAMKGDAERGAKVLSLQGKLGACYACHFINGTGKDFGPDLSHVVTRLSKAQILESILQPSKTIAQGFNAVALEMNDGSSYVGFVVKEDGDNLHLKTATGLVEAKKADVKKRTPLPASLMPEGQLASLTAQEAADVLAFLGTLR
jgi:putative heme-binding domain-containing protein